MSILLTTDTNTQEYFLLIPSLVLFYDKWNKKTTVISCVNLSKRKTSEAYISICVQNRIYQKYIAECMRTASLFFL